MCKIKEFINKNKKILSILFYLILPILIELILYGSISLEKSCIKRIIILYGIIALIPIYKIINHFSNKLKMILDYIIRYRYIIALVVFVIGIAFKINFSSIDAWCGRIGEENVKSTIIGIHRDIRSDEWLTQTPIFIAQTQNEEGYKLTNEDYMQGNGNMIMASAPTWDISTIARPFLWGYLLLGQEYGFSWWWMLRVVLLVLVSCEIAIIITKRDTLLTIVATLILALAPPMMWWLSTAVIDAYIFGMALIVLFHYYMKNLDSKIWKKLLIALGVVIVLPAFAFALYPAYQVPLAFVMAIFMINDLIKNFKKLKKKDYFIMAITIIIVTIIILHFLIVCWNDIQIMMNTVYPGHRLETGGDYTINKFVKYFNNIFLPYGSSVENPCEESTYIYPLIGLCILIVSYINIIRKRKNNEDKFLKIGLMILFAIFLLWMFVGFTPILSKITLMYFSPAMRTQLVTGLIGTLLAIILLKDMGKEKILSKLQAFIISIIVTIFSYILIKQSPHNVILVYIKLEIVLIMIFAMTYFLITLDKKKFAYVMCIIAIIAGITVNPIVSGIKIFSKTEISEEIHKIEDEDSNQLWIGKTDQEAQYLLANGIKVLNGVHNYPNFEWIDIVDKDRKYNEIFNRYAHICIKLGEKTQFTLIANDTYEVELTYENIKDLGVKYYFSMGECSQEIIDKFNLYTKYENQEKGQYIYEFK